MNKTDRARLEAILERANTLLNAPKLENNHITDINVLEAVLADIQSVLANGSPFETAKLMAKEEAHKTCKCPTPNVFHYKGCDALVAAFNERTSDGHQITDGMAVWDYNLRPGFVRLSRLSDDGWFEVCAPGEERGSMMNAERVCVRHPSSGDAAHDILKAR